MIIDYIKTQGWADLTKCSKYVLALDKQPNDERYIYLSVLGVCMCKQYGQKSRTEINGTEKRRWRA